MEAWMLCAECQQENPAGAKFCGTCGARLAPACSGCGATHRPGQAFCWACGARIPPLTSATTAGSPGNHIPRHLAERILTSKAALEGERKQVTVLFADLKGSTELLADRDPEESRKLLDPVLDRMMEAVHYYEGTVNQVLGDGIMALFGAPLAHEDHATRGCYAALRMQESVKRYSEEVFRTVGVAIHIRVGLNSGEVVVRSIGNDLHMDYTAVGQTTHLAARMEQMATPGSILIPGTMLGLTRDAVAASPLGPRSVKGLAAPIEIHEVTGASTTGSRRQAAAMRDLTRFVGRHSEMTTLHQTLERAATGHGQVVAIAAEPGVGKSRLIREFLHSDAAQGWRILEATGVSSGKTTAYLPLIEPLRTYFEIDAADTPHTICDKIATHLHTLQEDAWPSGPALLQVLNVPADDPAWQTLDPLRRREHTLETLRRLVLHEGRIQPLLLVFDSLHWMDSQTHAFLDAIVQGLTDSRILLLITHRPEYQHPWSGASCYTGLRLKPLPADSARELLDPLLGSDPSLQALKGWLIGRTEGNPFFLQESIRALVETQVLTGERGAYRLVKPLASIQLPTTIHAVLAPRIDRLPPEAKRLLQAASVIGKDVPLVLLQAIADLSEDETRRNLTILQTGDFLQELRLFPSMEYTFRHALTQEVTYNTLLRERRRALHARVAEVLEQQPADRPGEQVESLAHHALRGEMWHKAVSYLRQAGAKAAARGANREAVGFLEQALAALSHLADSPERSEQAIDLRLDLRPPLLQMGELDRVLTLSQEAEAMAQTLRDESRLARVYTYLVNYYYLKGEPELAIEYGERCLRIGETAQDRSLQALARGYLGSSYHAQGRFREAERVLRQNLEALGGAPTDSATIQNRISFVTSAAWVAFTHADLGDFDAAFEDLDQAARAAKATGHPYPQAIAQTLAGLVHLRRGELEEALPLLQQSVDACREKGLDVWRPIPSSLLGLTRVRLGQVDEGLALLEESVSRTEALGVRAYLALWTAQLAEGLLAAGQIERARAAAQRALELALLHKERSHHARALKLLGDVTAAASPADPAVAEDSYRQALALADELALRPLTAQTLLGLGRLYQQTGRRTEAADRLADALLLLHDMGMRPWLSSTADALQALGQLFIVARSKRALYDDLQRELGGRPVTIILDRREGERRRRTQSEAPERRAGDRRRQATIDAAVRTRGFAIVVETERAASA
jgi:class 3 adenylate cyclase/tetratricopeptide (TPR) repeat protein